MNSKQFDSSNWVISNSNSLSFILPSFISSNPFQEKKQEKKDFYTISPEDLSESRKRKLGTKLLSDTLVLHSKKKQALETKEIDSFFDFKTRIYKKEKDIIQQENFENNALSEKKKLEREAERVRYHEERAQQLLKERNGEQVKYPSDWEPQSTNCELKEVPPTSEEFQRIEKRVMETLTDCKVTKIERIQNKWLWENYYNARWKLEEKNKGSTNELELFHGSRRADPELIYNGEDGFDMRFAAAGWWGRGIYFADRADYSNQYAWEFPGDDSMAKFFFAKVLVGDYVELPRDSDLKSPPEKPDLHKSELGFACERFDSVKGVVDKTNVFIQYTNGRAYPTYLITFKWPIEK